MRFLLDTNVLIPLEDSKVDLKDSLTNFVRVAHSHAHVLVYHPASEDDISRDRDETRRSQTLSRLNQYTRIEDVEFCPWNDGESNPNELADNRILYSIHIESAHYLVTEDRGIHDKAIKLGLGDRVLTIQTADDLLRRLHPDAKVQLPNIDDVQLYQLTSHLGSNFFDTLRGSYDGFDDWFRSKAREDGKAWVSWIGDNEAIGAICIYIIQRNETVTEEGLILRGDALKLSTFKVSAAVRGRKIGELMLKAAFKYATANGISNIFIHGDYEQHHFLFQLLEDFGFERKGTHPGLNDRDVVYVKAHPVEPPEGELDPFIYQRLYFPHFRSDALVSKFVIPIQPQFHEVLFPDYQPAQPQMMFIHSSYTVGNAIKLAYLCNAQTKEMKPGDIAIFYRSIDEKCITSIGVVENYEELRNADAIVQKVKRRTVYSYEEIERLAVTPVKVLLFRLVRHLESPIPLDRIISEGILKGAPQSITKINDQSFSKIINDF